MLTEDLATQVAEAIINHDAEASYSRTSIETLIKLYSPGTSFEGKEVTDFIYSGINPAIKALGGGFKLVNIGPRVQFGRGKWVRNNSRKFIDHNASKFQSVLEVCDSINRGFKPLLDDPTFSDSMKKAFEYAIAQAEKLQAESGRMIAQTSRTFKQARIASKAVEDINALGDSESIVQEIIHDGLHLDSNLLEFKKSA